MIDENILGRVIALAVYLASPVGVVAAEPASREQINVIVERIKAGKTNDAIASSIDALTSQANSGNTDAMLALADLYRKGQAVPANLKEAIGLYERAAKSGKAVASFQLGEIYYADLSAVGNAVKAYAYFETAAKGGIPFAEIRLGECLVKGVGVKKDIGGGIELLEKAAQKDPGNAYNSLGDIYAKGMDTNQDAQKAIQYYQKAAAASKPDAFYKIGEIYRAGAGVDRDFFKAVEYYQKAMDAGSTKAQSRYGEALVLGQGIARNVSLGMENLEQAGMVDSFAFIILGDIYSSGVAVERDGPKAVAYYKQALETGNIWATVKLGDIYRDGMLGSVDSRTAAEYYAEGVRMGVTSAKLRLGDAYLKGQGVPVDVGKGMELVSEAAASGDKWALLALGDYVSRNEYVSADGQRAVEAFEQAAGAGNTWSFLRLADIYTNGTLVKADPEKAINYYEKAAAAGISQASVALAEGHRSRRFGKFSDPQKGEQLLADLIKNGDATAAVRVANDTFWGRGVPRNLAKALSMLEKASAAGNLAATRQLVSYYRDGAGREFARSPTKARAVLEARKEQFPPEMLAQDRFLLTAATASGVKDYRSIADSVRQLPTSLRLNTLIAVKNANPNVYVFLAQEEMARRGLYKGPSNGQLTKSTIRSINRLCASAVNAEKCKLGPLNYEAVRVVSILLDQSGN